MVCEFLPVCILTINNADLIQVIKWTGFVEQTLKSQAVKMPVLDEALKKDKD